MSFLDIYNKQAGAAGASSFTDKAQAMKSALTGKEQAAPTGPAKSQVAEATATSAAGEEKKNLLQQAQGTQTKFEEQKASIAQTRQLTAQEYAQKKDEVVAQAQRQLDQIHAHLSDNIANMDVQQKEAAYEQMSFLNSLTDRRYADNMVREGDRRRLDDESQMKTATMYAAFDDQIDLLNKDLEFRKAINGDNNAFQEYLATLNPEAAIQAALTKFKSEQSQRAGEGMAAGVEKAIPGITGYAADKAKAWAAPTAMSAPAEAAPFTSQLNTTTQAPGSGVLAR